MELQFPATASSAPVAHPFIFRGTASEYFRIWIVNLALSILTLGVFSAWAKVRSERWFYGNTWVADAPFEYLAPPLTILKGRLIALAILILYVMTIQLLPVAEPLLLFVLSLGMPWLFLTRLRFRARYSAWRTLNFRFVGTARDSAKYYYVVFVLMLPTLGLIFPHIRYLQRRYNVEGHRFGGQALSFLARSRDFYAIYLLGLLVILLGTAACIGFGAWLSQVFLDRPLTDIDFEDESAATTIMVIVLVSYLGLLLAWIFISARITNLTYNKTTLGPHRFRSTVRARDLAGLYLTNTLAILLSLGLMIPWARVRMARYRARHMTLLADGPVDGFHDPDRRRHGAAGAETADLFDADISL